MITSHRYERTHNGRTYEVNYYGVVWDTEVKELVSCGGHLIEMKLYWKFLHNELVIVVDMHAKGSGDSVMSSHTTFCSGVHMRWNGQQYRIIENEYRGYNAFWVEMEGVIHACISINE